MPTFIAETNGYNIKVEVQNFGQVGSKMTQLKIVNKTDNAESIISEGKIPPLQPFEKIQVNLESNNQFEMGKKYFIEVVIEPEGQKPVLLKGSVIPNE